jgi:hypothetical protein
MPSLHPVHLMIVCHHSPRGRQCEAHGKTSRCVVFCSATLSGFCAHWERCRRASSRRPCRDKETQPWGSVRRYPALYKCKHRCATCIDRVFRWVGSANEARIAQSSSVRIKGACVVLPVRTVRFSFTYGLGAHFQRYVSNGRIFCHLPKDDCA